MLLLLTLRITLKAVTCLNLQLKHYIIVPNIVMKVFKVYRAKVTVSPGNIKDIQHNIQYIKLVFFFLATMCLYAVSPANVE